MTRFVKSRYSRYSSVSDMHDVLGWTPLSQMKQEARLIMFSKLLTVWHKCTSKPEGVLVEAYKGTRGIHSFKFRQISHTSSMYGQLFFLKLLVHGTGLLSRKLRHWLYLDPIFLTIRNRLPSYPRRVLRNIESESAALPHNTLEGSCGIIK